MAPQTGRHGIQKTLPISEREGCRPWLNLPLWRDSRHPIQFGDRLTATCVSAAVLTKLAKHLALLASLAILGEAGGRIIVSQPAIFTVIVLAALFHSIGRALRLRLRQRSTWNKDGL